MGGNLEDEVAPAATTKRFLPREKKENKPKRRVQKEDIIRKLEESQTFAQVRAFTSALNSRECLHLNLGTEGTQKLNPAKQLAQLTSTPYSGLFNRILRDSIIYMELGDGKSRPAQL